MNKDVATLESIIDKQDKLIALYKENEETYKNLVNALKKRVVMADDYGTQLSTLFDKLMGICEQL